MDKIGLVAFRIKSAIPACTFLNRNQLTTGFNAYLRDCGIAVKPWRRSVLMHNLLDILEDTAELLVGP